MNISTHPPHNAGLYQWLRTRSQFGGLLAAVIAGLLSTGCNTMKPASPAADNPVAPISVAAARNDETLILSDEALPDDEQQPADPATNRSVRWGGTISRIQNTADQLTEIEIVSRPLRRNGRPVHNDRSDGRFMAKVATFLDPEIVKVGRDITVTGTLHKRHSGKVGESDYVFPVVKVDNYTYWKKQQQRPQRHFPHWTDLPRHSRDPFWSHDPFWPHWYLFHPHRGSRY